MIRLRNITLLALLPALCSMNIGLAQRGLYINGAEASLRVDTGAFLSVDGDFVNNDCDPVAQVRFNGTLYLAGSLTNNDSLRFAGSTNSSSARSRLIFRTSLTLPSGTNVGLHGSVAPKLWQVVIDKPNGGVTLYTDVASWDTVSFVSGRIFMNGRKWRLQDPVGAVSVMNHPWIRNESSASRFMALSNLDTGRVIYHTTYPQSAQYNPANLGIQIKGPLDHGSFVDFERGFRAQQVGKAGVAAYYSVKSPAYALSSNSISIRYFASDAQYYTPGYFVMPAAVSYVSGDNDNEWNRVSTYTTSGMVFGNVTQGTLSLSLSQLGHPNVALDGKALRFTVGDPLCIIKPVSDIYIDTLRMCEGNIYTIDAGTNSDKYEWNSTPPTYGRTLSVTTTPYYQHVKVQLSDLRGCVVRDSLVVAPGLPYPQFTYVNHLNACLGDSITIKDTAVVASGSCAVRLAFSDTTLYDSTGHVFRKMFLAPGQYSVELVATSDYGCMSVASITNMEVYPLPTADFDFSHSCLTDAVTFTNMSVSNHTSLVISSLLWSIEGAAAQTVAAPAHTFSSAGIYTVQLRATTSFGCRDSATNTVTIHPRNIAGFLKSNRCHGSVHSFTNVTACNTGSCSYAWELGAGKTTTLSQPQVNYDNPGAYLVKLKVTNPIGCPDSTASLVVVHPVPAAYFSQSASSLCVNNPVYFTNGSTVSSGSLISYSWDLGDGSNVGTLHASASYSAAGNYMVRLIVVSDSGCVDSVSQAFTSFPQPLAQFSVSNVCHRQLSAFQSSSQGNGLSHFWQLTSTKSVATGAGNSVLYEYPSPGQYSARLIAIDNNGCSDTAWSQAIVRETPTVNLGGEIKTCGYSYTLNAQNTGASYNWSPGGSQTQTLVAISNGSYGVVVTGSNGCSAASSVSLTLNGEVHPFLGNDTTACDHLILDAGYPGSYFEWGSGDTTQTLTADSSGMYMVTVTDKNQCSGTDSIFLTILEVPEVRLGHDTLLCVPQKGIDLECISNAAYITWNNGSTGTVINVSSPGIYCVSGTGVNGCQGHDSITIAFLPTPAVDLGPDTGACGYVDLNSANMGCDYTWHDGFSGQYHRITETSQAHVKVTNRASGCTAYDTVNVEIYPPVIVNLGADTAFCSNSATVLDAANDGAQYTWLDGSSQRTVEVTSGGIYGVQVINQYGCMGSDYIAVTVHASPTVNLGADTRYICGTTPVTLTSPFESGNVWSSQDGFVSAEREVSIHSSGKFWLQVMSGQCSASDTVLVSFTSNTIQARFLASTMDTVNKPVKFVNLSEPEPISQTWFFGDGAVSSEFSPVHTYLLPTDFSVTLEVSNGYCTDRITKALSVLFRMADAGVEPPAAVLEMHRFRLFPNPAPAMIRMEAELNAHASWKLQVTDLAGRVLLADEKEAQVFAGELDLRQLANGCYVLHIGATSEKGAISRTVKFVKTD